MAKMKVGGRRRISRGKIFFIVSVLFLVLLIQGFWLLDNRIEPILRNYANQTVTEIATSVIEEAVKERITNNPDFSKIITVEKDHTGRIQAITVDAQAANRVQVETTDHVRKRLNNLKAEKITVPLGVALDSTILASLGPEIPITFVPIGSIKVDIIPELKEQGINMVLFSLNLKITTNLQIVIPFSSQEAIVDHYVTIAQQLIVGDVPVYYFNGTQTSPVPVPTLPSNP